MRVPEKKSGRTTHGNKQAKTTLTEAAWAASRTKNTFYHARYHRLSARRDKKRAIIAVAHSMLKSVYHVLKDNVPYHELGAGYLDKRMEDRRRRYLKNELQKMGFDVRAIHKWKWKNPRSIFTDVECHRTFKSSMKLISTDKRPRLLPRARV